MVSPTQLCWRYHNLPLSQRYNFSCLGRINVVTVSYIQKRRRHKYQHSIILIASRKSHWLISRYQIIPSQICLWVIFSNIFQLVEKVVIGRFIFTSDIQLLGRHMTVLVSQITDNSIVRLFRRTKKWISRLCITHLCVYFLNSWFIFVTTTVNGIKSTHMIVLWYRMFTALLANIWPLQYKFPETDSNQRMWQYTAFTNIGKQKISLISNDSTVESRIFQDN